MLMRLAFSISTSVEADILLMDEWLSVGDAEFTEKAEKRMKDVVAKSGILVLASHSPDLIAKECNRVIHLEHGRIVEAARCLARNSAPLLRRRSVLISSRRAGDPAALPPQATGWFRRFAWARAPRLARLSR